MKNLLLFLLFINITFCVAQPYKGIVYLDNNRNGVFDSGDKKLKNVAVSDGLQVVLTDTDGRFSLSGHRKARFIYITLPSGYTIQKHYIPTSSKEFDFGLKTYPERVDGKGNHKFIHLADTEISEMQTNESWAGTIRDYARNEKAAFIIHTGDICYPSGLESHIKLMNTDNMECQTFYCIGNHDLVKGKYGEEMFERLYGPVYYSFDVGNVHYIVTPMLGGDYKPSYTRTDVYEWMKNDLALVPSGKAVMFFSHDLLTHTNEFRYGSDESFVDLNQHNLKAWFYGHWHIHHIKKQGSVYGVSTSTPDKGGIDHSVSAFRVMHVDSEGDFRSELRYTYIDKKMNIVFPPDKAEISLNENNKTLLSVNAYHTVSPVSKVVYMLFADGKLESTGELKRNTDWNYSVEIPISHNKKSKAMRVTAKAFYANGEVSESTANFKCRANPLTIDMSNPWVNLLGNAVHHGVVPDTIKTPLQPVWATNVGANLFMASPIVLNRKVYVATVDENYQGKAAIVALDGKTGKEAWRFTTRNSIKNTIAAAEGNIFAQDTEGFLYAIDAETGKKVWEKKLNVAALPAVVEGITTSKGIVYAGTGKGLCAVDAITGKTFWENTDWSQHEGATSTITCADNKIFSGAQWAGVYANDASTGKMLWHNGKDGLSDRGSSPVAINGILYLISRSSLFVLNPETGQTILRKELPVKVDVTSTPIVTEKRIIFGSQSGLVCLAADTYETEWIFDVDEAVSYTGPYTRKGSRTVETSPVLSGNTVFFGASDGNFYAVNAASGKLLWKHTTVAPIFSSPALSGNTVLFTDYGGNVYAFVSE